MKEVEIRNYNYSIGNRSVCKNKCKCKECKERIKIMKKENKILGLDYFKALNKTIG